MTDEEKAPYPTTLEYEADAYDGPREVRLNGQRLIVHRLEVVQEDGEFNRVTLTLRGVHATVTPRGNG